MDEALNERARAALIASRAAARELMEARDSLAELEGQTIGSPRLDGMPRGSGGHDASASRLIHLDYARRKLDMAERAYKRARHAAEAACEGMEPHMHKFCAAYYAEGFPFEVARTLSGVGDRQCYRYVRMIEGKEE